MADPAGAAVRLPGTDALFVLLAERLINDIWFASRTLPYFPMESMHTTARAVLTEF